ncbi:MAG: hypothetical protein O7C74_07120 [Acidobacteria bacterium]|nr:hypothetical protein [Acidobacteriota bacterium]
MSPHRSSLPRGSGLLMALAAVLAGSPLLLYPPGRDQSVFLLAGRALSQGVMPYTGFWDIKPPGLFVAYLLPGSLAFAWPGAAALLDLAALALAVVAAVRLLGQWGNAAAGAAAAVILTGLWIFAGDWWDLGQGERLAVPLLLLALLAAGRPRTWRWATAGFLIGLMVLLKTSFLPMALILLPLLPPRRAGKPAGDRPASTPRLLVAAALGLAAPLAFTLSGLLAGGALAAAGEATVSFTGHYTRLAWRRPGVLFQAAGITTLAFLRTTWPLWILAMTACRLACTRRLPGPGVAMVRGVWSLTLALALAAAAILAQGKFFPYHWIAIWPPLALLAGVGAAALGRRLAARLRPAAATVAALLIAVTAITAGLLGAAPGWSGWHASLLRAAGGMDSAAHLARFRVQGMGYDELAATARRVAAATRPHEPLLMWGFEPAFYLYAQRPFPGRFPFAYPLVAPWAPTVWRQGFLAAVDATPPAAIVVRRGDPIPWVAGIPGDAAARLRRFPPLNQRLRREYLPRPDLSSPHLQVWVRVAAPPPGR